MITNMKIRMNIKIILIRKRFIEKITYRMKEKKNLEKVKEFMNQMIA